MIAKTPAAAVQMADDAFNRRDIDAMLAFYEDDAAMMFEPNEATRGKVALREVLTRLLAMNPIAKHETAHVIESGDLALWTSKWSVSGTAPDGSPVIRRGSGSAILRKGSDGGWRVALENPWRHGRRTKDRLRTTDQGQTKDQGRRTKA